MNGGTGRRIPPSGDTGFRHRVRYRFDNLLARGTWAALVWLGAVTFAAVLVSSLLLWAFGVTFAGSDDGSWLEDFWQSMLRVMDPGTMAGDVGWGRRILALLVTVFGLLVAGTLIGVIAAGVEQRIERMRHGRSVVIESDHIVILGTSERLPIVVHQLVLANAGRGGTVIVVMADRDPAEMADDVHRVVDDRLGSRLVFRSGDPTRTTDLALVRLDDARTVIVLGEEGAGDSRAVKTVLAIGDVCGGFDALPMVVELDDPAKAATLVRACGPQVHPFVAAQAVGRTAAFALRQPGLSQVIDELMDFRGCDVHIRDHPELVGRTFGDTVMRYAKARPIGRMRPDGRVALNPDPGTRFENGDRLVVIADDASDPERAAPGTASSEVGDGAADHTRTSVDLTGAPRDEHLLVMGWSSHGVRLLSDWAPHTATTSTVEIVFDPDLHGGDIVIPGLDPARITVTAARDGAGLPDRPPSTPPVATIVLLPYADGLPVDEADGRTLLDLKVIRRDLADRFDDDARFIEPRVIVELLDVENVPLADVGPDDYVVSQAIGSHFIAQLADTPERRAVMLELYGGGGPSLHLVSAGRLGLTGEVSAAEIIGAAYASGVLAIGWRRRSTGRSAELVLNPHLSDRVLLDPGDEVVVVG